MPTDPVQPTVLNPLHRMALLLGVVALALGLFSGCGPADSGPGADQAAPDGGMARSGTEAYTVVCTVGMVADVVRHVAGEQALVSSIIGAGVDPHVYTPTSTDVKKLMAADVVFYSGLNLEGKMGNTLAHVAEQGKKPVVAVTEAIDASFLLAPPEFAGHYDPHVWMDVQGWSRTVEVVLQTLSAYDPARAALYATNAAAYRAELEKLDAYAKERVQTIPEKSRVLVTAHDAFNYFGRAYGLELMGIQGISTESEPGLDDINRLVDVLKERDIAAVFVESSVPEKNVNSLIEGSKARGHVVHKGGLLFSDAMGLPGTYEGTYIGMIDHNVTTIVRALGGEAPETGMQGKLSGVTH